MTRSRRPPRRQGVVYGPVQDRDGYEASSLIGRILGMLVVAGAAGLLAVGSLSFLGGGNGGPVPAASPTGTAVAGASPDVTAGPTVVPPPTTPPTPASTAPPAATEVPGSPEPSPGATPFELTVREGPGFVTFGTENNSALRITNARTSFALNERITWSANLASPANSVDLRVEIAKVDPATGAEDPLRTEEVRPQVTGASVFLRRIRPNRALDGPGVYAVRYLRGSTLMAEGFFEVTP